MTGGVAEPRGRAIEWHWAFFLLGVVYALPAVVVIPFHPLAGLGLAIGVLPVAAFNLPGRRRGRRVIPVVGVLSAASILVGSLLAQIEVVAVVGMFVLSLVFTLWARRSRAGMMALVLCLPLVGVALTLRDVAAALLVAMLVLAGSLYGWGVAMVWPEHRIVVPARAPALSRTDAATYGLLLGGAAATSTAVGYALGFTHVGWATGATLLVMRPVREALIRSSLRRSASVVLGALTAAAFQLTTPAPIETALVIGLVLAALSATQASRWFVSPAFTSFIGLTLILQDSSQQPALRFAERLVETAVGVGAALWFGAAIPLLITFWRTRADHRKGLTR